MKKIVWLFILPGVFFSCQPEKEVYEERIIENNISLLRDLMELWETRDTVKTRKIFLENCEYNDVANNITFSGINDVNKYISHVHNWGSNIKMEIREINVSTETGYAEWTFTAIQTKPIEGRVLVATNKEINLKGVTLVEFGEEKIQQASDYMDVLGFVLQLGASVELPGGIVIEE